MCECFWRNFFFVVTVIKPARFANLCLIKCRDGLLIQIRKKRKQIAFKKYIGLNSFGLRLILTAR